MCARGVWGRHGVVGSRANSPGHHTRAYGRAAVLNRRAQWGAMAAGCLLVRRHGPSSKLKTPDYRMSTARSRDAESNRGWYCENTERPLEKIDIETLQPSNPRWSAPRFGGCEPDPAPPEPRRRLCDSARARSRARDDRASVCGRSARSSQRRSSILRIS